MQVGFRLYSIFCIAKKSLFPCNKKHSFNFLDFYPFLDIEINLRLSICYVLHHAEKLSDAWSLIKYHTAARNFGFLEF